MMEPGTHPSSLKSSDEGQARRRRGRLAPYPVWLVMTSVVRGAQLGFVACCAWYLAALFDAMSKPHTISTPPGWLWLTTIVLGTTSRAVGWPWKLSPVGDAIANCFASHRCPTCGQDIYDHTPPHGYASDADRQSFLPSRTCANCGHDLTKRSAK